MIKRTIAIFMSVVATLTFFSGVATAGDGVPDITPLIDARPCNDQDPTPQIRLVLGPGAVICYGGTVGSMRVDNVYARGLQSGGYWGFFTCSDLSQTLFEPHEVYNVSCNVIWMGITCPNWRCSPAAPDGVKGVRPSLEATAAGAITSR